MEKTQNELVRGRHLCSQLSILQEVSQNFFVFDGVNLETFEENSQNRVVFDVVQFNN